MAEETITAQTPEIDPGMSVVPEAPGLMDVPTVIPELELAAQALASQVSFAKKTWKDGSGGGTPVTAAELNRLEQGVADLTAAVNALRDSVSQIVRFSTHIESATVFQNVTAGGGEPIMVRVKTDDPNHDYALSVHKSKRIELYDYAAKRSVWSANLTSLCS